MDISGFRCSLISFLFFGFIGGIEFLSGENPLSDAAQSGRQMNFHHLHGGHPNHTTGVVE
jgi:hypothetical protein